MNHCLGANEFRQLQDMYDSRWVLKLAEVMGSCMCRSINRVGELYKCKHK
jgi:hypothetical protein